MWIPWFADTAEWVLREYNDPDIGLKIKVVRRVRKNVWNLLGDYFHNEDAAIRFLWKRYPEDRLREFTDVCKRLQTHTVGELLTILDDYDSTGMATEKNREYLLGKLGFEYHE